MNMKSMIAAAAVVASTVASAATFQWTVSLDNDASWDKIWINAYDNEGVDKYNKGFAKGTDKMEFTFDVDDSGKAYLDGTEIVNIKFGVYNGSTYIGNTTANGYEWNKGDLSWEAIYSAIKNGQTLTTDLKLADTTQNPWVGNKVGTISITPEPTSGLMLLLGTGLLALRRKAVRA